MPVYLIPYRCQRGHFAFGGDLHRYRLAALPAIHKETDFHLRCCCLAAHWQSEAVTLLSTLTLKKGLGLISRCAQHCYFCGNTVFNASHPDGPSRAALQPRHIFLSPQSANDLGRLFISPVRKEKLRILKG